ncbi:TetR/AcrR family transcriptional regulator [Mucilaginibacter sp. RS28]|uniref:TetR/AcrR family transcriptional regulator n=1 Tax=Mucilaginibacter straminoryzae TaxID=2932774 RepID=A0A9X2BEL5_9SPHI|nr:TetR/AcrR family transcriptional regulator [Mucilaginibacter straminoryzae]MCJ8211533.1 TetR/AcrR family transcriptional regulator [Mucilaginibacter straminoryzae]
MDHRERILSGSLELFMQAGIKGVTMDDIARHLGMSKKTIYQFFADKNELVIELVKLRMREDEDMMQDLLKNSENVIEQLVKMMRCQEEVVGRMNPMLIHDLQKYHPEGWKQIQNFKSAVFVDTLEQILKEGIEQGYIRPEIDAKIISRMRMAQVDAGFNQNIFPHHEFNAWVVQQQFLEHFNYGICTLAGYKLLHQYQSANKVKS